MAVNTCRNLINAILPNKDSYRTTCTQPHVGSKTELSMKTNQFSLQRLNAVRYNKSATEIAGVYYTCIDNREKGL